MSVAEVLVSTSEFLSAGLDPEGIYRLRFSNFQVVEKIAQTGRNAGGKYKQIDGQAELIERFGGTDPGMLEYPIREFLHFYTTGKQAERFRKIYVAAFGSVPESAPGVISLNDLASALNGVDTVWTTLYWRRNKKDNTVIEQSLGYSFYTDPSKLSQPTPFAQRDAAFAASLEGTTDEDDE
jgi:hypothetical protein